MYIYIYTRIAPEPSSSAAMTHEQAKDRVLLRWSSIHLWSGIFSHDPRIIVWSCSSSPLFVLGHPQVHHLELSCRHCPLVAIGPRPWRSGIRADSPDDLLASAGPWRRGTTRWSCCRRLLILISSVPPSIHLHSNSTCTTRTPFAKPLHYPVLCGSSSTSMSRSRSWRWGSKVEDDHVYGSATV
jgi:hypothetical protein